MTMQAIPIRRIWEMADHPQYGPIRRAWVILEQLFADKGGVSAFELALWAAQEKAGRGAIHWDRHLEYLLCHGQSEPDALRTVVHQMLVAAEFIR